MVASHRVATAGWKVAVADYRPFGGMCAPRGCDPKKVLVGAVQVIDDVRRMTGRGVAATDAHIDWHQLIEFNRSFTRPVSANQEKRYAEKGIDAYHGRAKFTGRNTIEVSGNVCETRHVLLATGARPAPLGFPGEKHLVTNEEFLELEELPKRIVLVGGGYIAAEFSHIAARAGARVTILQRGDRLLPQSSEILSAGFWRGFTSSISTCGQDTQSPPLQNAELLLSSRPNRVTIGERPLNRPRRTCRRPHPRPLRAQFGCGGGRSPRARTSEVEQVLQSVSNPSIYAAGDAAQKGLPLTPVASHDANIVAWNLLEGNRHTADYRGVPSVSFTIPPIARVGLREEEGREQGLTFRIKSQSVANWYSTRRFAETVYGFKVLVEESTERILGAHLVGPHADEVINLFGLGIRNDLTAAALKDIGFGCPTVSSDVAYML